MSGNDTVGFVEARKKLREEFHDKFGPKLIKLVKNDIKSPHISGVFYWEPGKNNFGASVNIMTEHKRIAGFRMEQMQGCCAVLISFDTIVYEEYRGLGIGTLMQSMKEWIARKRGFVKIISTSTTDNEVQTSLLKSSGWTRLSKPFCNPKTDNVIVIWEKNVG